MASVTIGDDADPGLVSVLQLLLAAAHAAWDRAEAEGPWSIWHARGLGAYIAACHCAALLDADIQDAPLMALGRVADDGDPVASVRAAEAACRAVGIEAWPLGASALVVAVGDLVREWTHDGD